MIALVYDEAIMKQQQREIHELAIVRAKLEEDAKFPECKKDRSGGHKG